jgi:hypothetical protein
MKRFCLTVLFATAAIFTVYSQTGIIRELTGDVEIKRAGQTTFTAASAGDTVTGDTIISTGFRSSAIIAIGSSVITVRPLTRLSLADIQRTENSESVNVNLQAGRVRVDVNPPAGTRANFNVQGPAASASVRGTSFEMDTKNLSVTSGSVSWRDSNGFSAAVTVGFSSSVSDTGSVVDPVEVTAAEFTPPTPVGSGVSGETSTASAETASGDIDIEVNW